MDSGRRRFFGLIAGTAATAILTRGARAEIAPSDPGSDARFTALWSSFAPPVAPVPVPVPVPTPNPVGAMPALMPRALAAMDLHADRITDRSVIGLIDFSAVSRLPRLHIVDVAGGKVISSHLVAHGRGSDPANSGWAERFSNQFGSEASSNGSFVVGETYYGKHGRSRRVIGLDPDNDQAEARGIVIHPASYVGQDFVARYGRIGRSEGCFAVSTDEIDPVLALLGTGRMIFASR